MGGQLTFTKLSPHIDPAKKPTVLCPTCSYSSSWGYYFLRLLTAVKSALNQPASPRSSSTTIAQLVSSELHYGIVTAIGMSLILGLLVWEWSCNPGEWAHDYVASKLRV
jgi:hypothetical protein